MRISHFLWRHGLRPIDAVCAVAALGLTMSVTGCSADVSRFDLPSFSLNGDPEATGALPAETPARQSNLYDQSPDVGSEAAYQPPTEERSRETVRTTALPDPTPTYNARPSNSYQSSPTPAAAPSVPTNNDGSASGGEISVVRGDTLYGLARRHGVSVSELMDANDLSSSALRPGQTLVLPGSASSAPRRDFPSTRTAARTPSLAAVPSDWSGSYTVVSGDSLYRIARQFGVKSSELQRNNGITDPRRIRPGRVLRVPTRRVADAGGASRGISAGGRVGPAPPKRVAVKTVPVAPALPKSPRVIQSKTKPTTVLNAKKTRVAALSDRKTDASTSVMSSKTVTPPSDTSAKLSWPVKGKVIDGFGRRRDGTHNDGVNLAVPLGTPVFAAEEGVVAYAGSELKGYGNLILIRHDNGWVTAYAHNQEIMVKRGDKVKRGQPIAKAGRTGQVDQPQVHFELRKGSKPVDPMPYLTASKS